MLPAVIFVFGLGIYSISVPRAMEKNYWFVSLMCFVIGGCLILFTAAGLIKHRPISIDESGVSTYLCGRLLKHISWPDIRRIERRRYVDPRQTIARYKYSIYGAGGRIWFDDRLQNLRTALDALNRFSRTNDIELIEIDAGIDTKRRLRDTVIDPIERKKLQRDGVETGIQSL